MNVKRLIVSMMAVSLALAGIGAAYAQEAEETTREGFVGTVSSYSGTTLVIEVTDEDTGAATSVTITAVTEDNVKTPGQSSLTPEEALEPGAKVAVLAQMVDGAWEAVQVVVKPTEPTFVPLVGAVVGAEGNEIQIMLPNGDIKTIQLPPNASAPGIGEVVTAFSRGGDEDDTGGPPVATGLVRASEVGNRLRAFIDQADTDTPGSLDEIALLVLSHAAHQEEVITRILANPNLPAQAIAGMTRGLANAQEGRLRAQETATQARAKAEEARAGRGGRPEGSGQGSGTEDETCADGSPRDEDGDCPGDAGQGGQGQGNQGQGNQGQGGS